MIEVTKYSLLDMVGCLIPFKIRAITISETLILCDICNSAIYQTVFIVSNKDCMSDHKDTTPKCYYKVCSKRCVEMATLRML